MAGEHRDRRPLGRIVRARLGNSAAHLGTAHVEHSADDDGPAGERPTVPDLDAGRCWSGIAQAGGIQDVVVKDRPGLDDILPTEACSRHIPQATFLSLPRLSYCEAYARSELVLPRVTGTRSSRPGR